MNIESFIRLCECDLAIEMYKDVTKKPVDKKFIHENDGGGRRALIIDDITQTHPNAVIHSFWAKDKNTIVLNLCV